MPRCSGVTKKGARCTRKWRTLDPGLSRRPWYCEQHQWQRGLITGWRNDTYTGEHGTYAIASEQVRGEPRFYSAMVWNEDRKQWLRLAPEVDGSTDKRAVKRRIERYDRSKS